MKKVLVIFGSKSDSSIYERIIKVLKDYKIDYDLEIASAHRNPDRVHEIVERNYSVIIAGAGLSAALPGVVASKTIRPVIGVPCDGGYQGLDALLSIAQMPKGIPVMAVGVNEAETAAMNAINCLRDFRGVNIIGNKNEGAVRKAIDMLERMEVPFKFGEEPSEDYVNIEFVYFDEPVQKKEQVIIYCPLLIKEDNKAQAALNLLNHSVHGLWVGLNNGINAANAAVQILNKTNLYEQALISYREELK